MKSQRIIIDIGYATDYQEFIYKDILENILIMYKKRFESKHKENFFKIKSNTLTWIQGVFDGVLKYTAHNDMTYEDFAYVNKDQLRKYHWHHQDNPETYKIYEAIYEETEGFTKKS